MSINNIMPDDSLHPRKKKNTSPQGKKKIQPTASKIPLQKPVVQKSAKKQTPQNTLQQNIKDVIEQAVTRFTVSENTRRHKLKDLYHLDTIVEEYLQAFMIIGYDINGEKVCITHARTPAERDAIIEHLRTTFIGVMNGLE